MAAFAADEWRVFLDEIDLPQYLTNFEAQQMSVSDCLAALKQGIINNGTLKDEFGIVPFGHRFTIMSALNRKLEADDENENENEVDEPSEDENNEKLGGGGAAVATSTLNWAGLPMPQPSGSEST